MPAKRFVIDSGWFITCFVLDVVSLWQIYTAKSLLNKWRPIRISNKRLTVFAPIHPFKVPFLVNAEQNTTEEGEMSRKTQLPMWEEFKYQWIDPIFRFFSSFLSFSDYFWTFLSFSFSRTLFCSLSPHFLSIFLSLSPSLLAAPPWFILLTRK